MAVKADGRSKPRPGIDEQRRHLVATATRLFSEQQASSVSVAELCREASVSRPTFYRCFDDKEALLSWVYDLAVHRYVEQIDFAEIPGDVPTEQWIRERVERIVDQVLSEPDLARFVFVEYGDPASPVRDLVNRRFRGTATELASRLQAATARAPSVRYIESVFASIQWILFETLRAGLTPARIDEAKLAVWEASMSMLSVRRP